ncbi:Crp/Fnr family transcriptional regulator [Bergeyella zoohelcum]|nr:Crp/Fnr family transcriptional regulator [Bergeyella zoohelcum]
MYHGLLIDFVRSLVQMTAEEEEEIIRRFYLQASRTDENLVSAGETCDKIFFICEGMLRNYYLNEQGAEITRLLSSEGEFCSNLHSFTTLSENDEYIQCLEDSVVLWISHEDFYYLVENLDGVRRIYIKILEKFQAFHIKRFQFLTTMSPLEKLIFFKERYPQYYERISNKVLASFLNMTPETCSRTKKKLKIQKH